MPVLRSEDFMGKKELAEYMGISVGTVNNRIAEIRNEPRYKNKDMPIIDDGQVVRVNVLVFYDYLCNRQSLKDMNLRKYLDPYDAEAVARAIGGFYRQRAVQEPEKPKGISQEELKSMMKEILLEGLAG